MKIIIAIIAFAAGAFAIGTLTTSTQAHGFSVLNMNPGDHFVCGINPDTYTIGAGTAIFDATVPANKNFNGTITVNGNLH